MTIDAVTPLPVTFALCWRFTRVTPLTTMREGAVCAPGRSQAQIPQRVARRAVQ